MRQRKASSSHFLSSVLLLPLIKLMIVRKSEIFSNPFSAHIQIYIINGERFRGQIIQTLLDHVSHVMDQSVSNSCRHPKKGL